MPAAARYSPFKLVSVLSVPPLAPASLLIGIWPPIITAYYSCKYLAAKPRPYFRTRSVRGNFFQSVATSGSVSVREHGPFHDPRWCTLHPSVVEIVYGQTLQESKSVF